MRCSVEQVLFAVVVVLAIQQRLVRALINDRCDHTKTLDCRIPNAFCQPVNENYGLCSCAKGFKVSRDDRACLTEIGKKACERHDDCDVANSACYAEGLCGCREKFMVSRDKTECLPPLGRSCRTSTNCTHLVPDSTCENEVCGCREHHVPSKDQTLCLPVLGQRCLVPGDCAVKNSYCDNGLCACVRNTHVPSYNKTLCLPVVTRILAPCDEDQQCANEELGPNTMCVNSACLCRYGNTEVNKTCSKRKELDDWCSHSQQCQMIERASCVQNKCSCDPYFVPFANNRTACVPIAMLYGSPCVDHVQCTAGFGGGASCVEGACLCNRDHHFVINKTGRCVADRGIGESCLLNDCYLPHDKDKQMIQCTDKVCACGHGTTPRLDNNSCAGAANIYATMWVFVSMLMMPALSALNNT